MLKELSIFNMYNLGRSQIDINRISILLLITFFFILHVNEKTPTPLLRKGIGVFSVLIATTNQL